MVNFNPPKHLNFEPYYGGDPAPAPLGESTQDILKSLTTYLPGLMQVENSQLAPTAQAQYDVAKNISPQYSDLLTTLYKQFAPELAQAGTKVENINRTGAAQTDLDILRGSGGDLAREAVKVDKELNPEYYKTRELQANKLGELLSSINLSNNNPEAERLISQENARSGNVGNPNATTTTANALSFGNEQRKRQDSLDQALNAATNFLQPSQGQFNPVVTALNRPSTNAGSNQFQGVTQNAGAQAYNSAGQFLNTIGGLKEQQSQINANRRDSLDRVAQVMGSVSV